MSWAVRGIPKCFCWPSGFSEAWGPKVKEPHMFRKSVLVCLAAEGGKANKTFVYRKCVRAERIRFEKECRSHSKSEQADLSWADFREDEKINPTPV